MWLPDFTSLALHSLQTTLGPASAVPAAAGSGGDVGIQPLPNCRDVRFVVEASAVNRNLTLINSKDVEAFRKQVVEDDFPPFPVSGPQLITGLFCEPTVINVNNNQLQLASHMVTANRNYWTALGGSLGFGQYQPLNYSWADYATSQGYAILALDRLGAGTSSHPDPVNVVQAPYEIALYHDLVEQIKSNKTGELKRAYKHVTYLGCSYGSVLGNMMSEVYPDDFRTIILTGFTYSIIESLTSSFKWLVQPGSKTDPLRFENLPEGYLQASNKTGILNSFFAFPAGPKTFDSDASDRFFERQDVVALGQFVSTYLNVTASPSFKGRILVLTGENDRAFCSSPTEPFSLPRCGSKVKDTEKLYPNAEYNWYQPDHTGHAPNMHHSNTENIKVAHEFLAGKRVGRKAP